ncbi:hypothetical protein RHSIM_Rhsim05G0215500 [Rhododendron simsii]|uniref:Uncharacterized protein n=1 Tax=Rhododendron simsii TaxID=118357 RepID=A0A834LQT8_RHOSS|nr:hypothetical protein RHSIM_Rhsim05G0215500 [Rhododendron simsii]
MAVLAAAVGCIDESPEGVAKWFQNLGHMKAKLATFQLYLHDQDITRPIIASHSHQPPCLFPLPFDAARTSDTHIFRQNAIEQAKMVVVETATANRQRENE